MRHADARGAWVEVSEDARGGLLLTVIDDGVGIADEATAGVGLQSMDERARVLGGRLEVHRHPVCGSVVRAVIPVGAVTPVAP